MTEKAVIPKNALTVLQAFSMLIGKPTDTNSIKQFLSDKHFWNSIYEFDKDNIQEERILKLKQFKEKEEFIPEVVKKDSVAVGAICLWLHMIVRYDEFVRSYNFQWNIESQEEHAS